SEEHTSELQSRSELVCRLLLEKKKKFPSPSAVPSIRPAISPIAHPVKQCSVALSAIVFRFPEWCSCDSCSESVPPWQCPCASTVMMLPVLSVLVAMPHGVRFCIPPRGMLAQERM